MDHEMKEYVTAAEAATEYLKQHTVFCRLMEGFREKYLSYGKFAGSVVLEDLTEEEIELLEGFFQTSYHGKKNVRITAAKFQKALESSRFSQALPEEILKQFFGRELQGKRTQKMLRRKQMDAVFDLVAGLRADTLAADWIEACRQMNEGELSFLFRTEIPQNRRYAWLRGRNPEQAHKDPTGAEFLSSYLDAFPEDLQNVACSLMLGAGILNQLPCLNGEQEYLPVFSAEITGDPHFLDMGTAAGGLLFQICSWAVAHLGKTVRKSPVFPFPKQRVCLAAGIILGDSTNYAMLYGVRAYQRGGRSHAGMDGFCAEQDMVQVPLHVLETWESVSCPDHTIWIVENPSVYSMLCSRSGGRYACMCMNGQPRLATLRMLDLLADAGVTIYYAGDFDPEGLLIAQKLRQYYPKPFHYWHMTEKDCLESLSGVELSESRMQTLARIQDPALLPAAGILRRFGRAGYQENIWEAYLSKETGLPVLF